MLERQKKWCLETAEKGKKWIDDHKFDIGCIVGATAVIAGSYAAAKIWEPKRYKVETIPINKDDLHGFGIRTSGVDRFGNDTCLGPWVLCCKEHDRERLVSNIDAALRGEKGQDYND